MAFTIGTKSPLNKDGEVKQWCDIVIPGSKKDKSDEVRFKLLISSLYSDRVRARQGYLARSEEKAARNVNAGTRDFCVTSEDVASLLKIEDEALKTLAEEVVHDWQDVNAQDGSAVEYSSKMMCNVFREWPQVRDAVEKEAIRIGLGIEQQAEETKEK